MEMSLLVTYFNEVGLPPAAGDLRHPRRGHVDRQIPAERDGHWLLRCDVSDSHRTDSRQSALDGQVPGDWNHRPHRTRVRREDYSRNGLGKTDTGLRNRFREPIPGVVSVFPGTTSSTDPGNKSRIRASPQPAAGVRQDLQIHHQRFREPGAGRFPMRRVLRSTSGPKSVPAYRSPVTSSNAIVLIGKSPRSKSIDVNDALAARGIVDSAKDVPRRAGVSALKPENEMYATFGSCAIDADACDEAARRAGRVDADKLHAGGGAVDVLRDEQPAEVRRRPTACRYRPACVRRRRSRPPVRSVP